MELALSTPKNTKSTEFKNKMKSKLLLIPITQSETFLFKLFNTIMLEFLTFKDFALGIQLLNTRFYFIFDEQPHILYYLAKTYYLYKDSPNFPMRKFFKKQLMNLNIIHDISIYKELHDAICLKIQLNKNMIKNHSGKQQFQHWEIKLNGGNGWIVEDFLTQLPTKTCFVASFAWNEISQTIKFDDFDPKVRELLKSGKALIKAGCYVARRWDCPAETIFEVKIFQDKKLLFEHQVYKFLDKNFCGTAWFSPYTLIAVTYEVNPIELPDTIKVVIVGKDSNWWG